MAGFRILDWKLFFLRIENVFFLCLLPARIAIEVCLWFLIFFFFCIGLFLFSLEPFRVFLVIHLLTFFSDVPFLWICFHLLCWTLWGYFNLEIYILWLGSFFLNSLIFFPTCFPCSFLFLPFLSFLNSLSSNPYSIRFVLFVFLLHFYFCYEFFIS